MKLLLPISLLLVAVCAYGHEHAGSGLHTALGRTAIGQAGKVAEVSRSVIIEMKDTMRFIPAELAVKRGETIRFVIYNTGIVRHEIVLGSAGDLKEHAKLMARLPGMIHNDPNQASVEPGATGELIWKFTKAGKIHFACLQPGHFEAGMVGVVAVK